jgi:hypothetical protein
MTGPKKDRAQDTHASQPQEDSYKYGDNPSGRLSGTSKPPVGDAPKPEDRPAPPRNERD